MTTNSQDLEALPQGHETILLVDDEASMRFVTTKALERCGFVVLTADSGPAALELWKAAGGGIRLLLTDVKMPGMTGCELAQTLQDQYPELKALFMSGRGPESLPGGMQLVDGVNFIRKPFTTRKLAQMVRDLLDRDD